MSMWFKKHRNIAVIFGVISLPYLVLWSVWDVGGRDTLKALLTFPRELYQYWRDNG